MKQESVRFAKLRTELSKLGVDAWLVATGDAHQSEYPASSDRRVESVSGFTGSNGAALIAADGVVLEGVETPAVLITDGRYTIQAAKQLDLKEYTVQTTGANLPLMHEYVSRHLGKSVKRKLGVDPAIVPLQMFKDLEQELKNHELVPIMRSPLDSVWGADGRPSPPNAAAFVHDIKIAGKSLEDKVVDVRKELQKQNATGLVVSSLDEVAWLLNIRGGDVDCTPVCISYAVVTMDEVRFYVSPTKVTPEVAVYLKNAGVTIKAYEKVFEDVEELAALGVKFWVDPAQTSLATLEAIKTGSLKKGINVTAPGNLVQKRSPIALPKAIKNAAEQKGIQDAHVRDGAAMARTLSWLEKKVEALEDVYEIDVADYAEEQRRKQDKFMDLSFPTIAATGPNGAITHYFPTPETNRKLRVGEMYLMDSGAQYLDGTTDVTRTMCFGEPPRELVERFTNVLKGHISLATTVFPVGTTGYQLDILARAPLWRAGIDYGHGTGHGVGAFLGVHEGPHQITFRYREDAAPLEAGMTVSNEPGFYKEGEYGIRIENILIVRNKTFTHQTSAKMLCFEPLTLIPFQARLIDTAMLTHEEIEYIDTYHERVWREISPLLKDDEDKSAHNWLRQATLPLRNSQHQNSRSSLEDKVRQEV